MTQICEKFNKKNLPYGSCKKKIGYFPTLGGVSDKVGKFQLFFFLAAMSSSSSDNVTLSVRPGPLFDSLINCLSIHLPFLSKYCIREGFKKKWEFSNFVGDPPSPP